MTSSQKRGVNELVYFVNSTQYFLLEHLTFQLKLEDDFPSFVI